MIMVLWAVVLLAALTTSFSASTRTGMDLARNAIATARGEALVEAGLNRVVMSLIAPPGGAPLRADGSVSAWSFGGGEVLFAVEDEEGKIDLNAASPELLRTLFAVLGEAGGDADALAEAVVDFRDGDDNRQGGGAEDLDYEAAGLAGGAKDAPFEHVGELAQVFGVTPALFRRVAPAVTVYSRLEEPDPDKAGAAVLEVIAAHGPGLSKRRGEGDDFAENSVSLQHDHPDLIGLRGSMETGTYTIHLEARIPGGTVVARSAVVSVNETRVTGFALMSWGPGQRSLAAAAAP